MKIDLFSEIEKDIKRIIRIFVERGNSTQEDYNFIRTPFGVGITFNPKLLCYREIYSDKLVSKIWIEGRIEVSEDRKNAVAVKMKEYLKEIGLRTFRDEDAFYGIYSHPEKIDDWERFVRFSFYVNPDYPDGCWDNHVL